MNALKCPLPYAAVDGALREPLAAFLNVAPGMVLDYRILKKSVDSRRGAPELIYSVLVDSAAELPFEKISPTEAAELTGADAPAMEPVIGDRRVVVIGTGPAGLFAAVALASAGAAVTVVDAGRRVDRRAADIARFFATRSFEDNSNYLIGEGGAGAFSDGKLYTRNRDARIGWVLRKFVDSGAEPETLYLKRPHLGSDRLPGIVTKLREEAEAMGAQFRFEAEVSGIIEKNGVCNGIRLTDGEMIEADAVVFAGGLGARRLVRTLIEKLEYDLKPFQIGCRIEHPQSLVDLRQYRVKPRPLCLGAAEYNLAMSPNERRPGVSTFCMCPGGEVIPAAAFSGELSSNGMSLSARSGEFANTALVVTPRKLNFSGGNEAFDFLADLGKRVFDSGGGDYSFPAQSAEGFLRGETRIERLRSSVRLGLRPFNLASLLPGEAVKSLREALRDFDRRFPGYIRHGNLIGVESYVSSPVRFRRGDDGSSSLPGFFPCGEAAGMAGGIMSAAVDGIDTAQKTAIFLNKRR
ncbi:MAG: FAD-dependent oxidoreductase [Victivallaceae bacterium]|nr:FAD-dependent oxidoreductase [Victivallaceae bacterium]